jgi:membrane protease YdiL (CAAX protease family)
VDDRPSPQPSTSVTTDAYPSLARTIGLLMVTLLVAAALAGVTMLLFPEWPEIVRMALPTELALAAAIVYAVRRTGLPWREALALRPLQARFIPPLALIVIGSVTVFSELYVVIQRITPVPDALESMLRNLLQMNGTADQVTTILIAVAIAPTLEEALFRGVILRGLARRHGPHAASLWTAIFFALFHLYNPWQIVPTFFLGLVLAWLVLSTRTLLASIIVHGLFNGLSLALVKAPLDDALPAPEVWLVAVIVLFLLAGSVALLAGLVWLEGQTGGGWFADSVRAAEAPEGDALSRPTAYASGSSATETRRRRFTARG